LNIQKAISDYGLFDCDLFGFYWLFLYLKNNNIKIIFYFSALRDRLTKYIDLIIL